MKKIITKLGKIKKNTDKTMSSTAINAINKNTALKVTDQTKSTTKPHQIINNITNNTTPQNHENNNPSYGGVQKDITFMKSQTAYPRWRQRMG
jgi:hypothetical protein